MSIQKSHYEERLATYSQAPEVIELFKHHRVYLEMVPSMRRLEESVIPVPLPIIRPASDSEAILLPCEVAVLLCDPEWKIKTGKEIFIFIHRPDEDFSDLLGRWRRTQVILSKNYEWVLPARHQQILNDGADKVYPLFVVFEDTPDRIKRGLKGAYLPFMIYTEDAQELPLEAS